MKQVHVKLPDAAHRALKRELAQWRKVRGPKFSLNDLCVAKLARAMKVARWKA